MTAKNRAKNLDADRIDAGQDGELNEQALDMVTGGDKPVAPQTVNWSHDDESPKETVTFEYGGMLIR
jgi:hypothetical protein